MSKAVKSVYMIINILLMTLGISLYSTASCAQGIAWQTWSDSAFTTAKQNQRMVLVYIKADWCHWCQKTSETTLQNASIIKLINSTYVPVRLDIDANADIAQQYGVRELPTFIIMNADKKVLKQFSGYKSVDELKASLD